MEVIKTLRFNTLEIYRMGEFELRGLIEEARRNAEQTHCRVAIESEEDLFRQTVTYTIKGAPRG